MAALESLFGSCWFVDLSLTIMENSGELLPVSIARTGHREGGDRVASRLVELGMLPRESAFRGTDLPDGEFLSNEEVRLSVHSATHLDAPFHFGSQSEGRPAMTIEEVPLDWCFAPGVVLDVSHRGAGESITGSDIESALTHVPGGVGAGQIVLLRTGADRYWGSPEYVRSHPGVSVEALELLVARGVKVIGIDAAGFDRPTAAMARDYANDRDVSHLWPAHLYGRKRSYCHIERLCNLDKLPAAHGFYIACFPVKIARAGAGWVRAVAIGPKDMKEEQ